MGRAEVPEGKLGEGGRSCRVVVRNRRVDKKPRCGGQEPVEGRGQAGDKKQLGTWGGGKEAAQKAWGEGS